MSKESTPGIFVFVGENRSKMAQEKGWSWQDCQTTGVPRLSAIPLWKALEGVGLNPNEQIFFNLWDDGWNLKPYVPIILNGIAKDDRIIIAMGKKVHKELEKLGIPHKEMIHPAARGKIRKTSLYQSHVKKVLNLL